MFHWPGHALVGDCVFHGSIGRTDLPGGSFDQLAASIRVTGTPTFVIGKPEGLKLSGKRVVGAQRQAVFSAVNASWSIVACCARCSSIGIWSP